MIPPPRLPPRWVLPGRGFFLVEGLFLILSQLQHGIDFELSLDALLQDECGKLKQLEILHLLRCQLHPEAELLTEVDHGICGSGPNGGYALSGNRIRWHGTLQGRSDEPGLL